MNMFMMNNYDCVLCPQNQVLSYATTNREGYREYKSKPYHCEKCPELARCTENKKYQKTVIRHIWQDYLEQAEDIRHSAVGRDSYAMRSQTIERVFADAKEKHGMRYTYYRGLNAVSKWVKLKFAAMNLKKMAIWKWKTGPEDPDNHPSKLFFAVWSIITRAKALRIKSKEPCLAFA